MRYSTALVILLLLTSPASAGDEQYVLGADSKRKDGIPAGKVSRRSHKSAVFPGTERDYWVYVPAQYDGSAPAAVMVFQDGKWYVN